MNLLQSPQHARAMAAIGWSIYGKPGQQIFYKKLGPVTLAKYQRPAKINHAYLGKFRRTHHPLLTIVEPSRPYSRGLPLSPYSHSATALIDLTLPEPALLTSFSPKTRYNLGLARRKGLLAVHSHPLALLPESAYQDFFALRTQWNQTKGDVSHDAPFLQAVLTSYAGHGYLHLAYLQDEPVSALLTLTCGRTSTYYTAYSTPAGNYHFAPTLLTWSSILSALKDGCSTYDFGGVYDPRYPKRYKNWQGFTKFKFGFCPRLVQYPPSRLLFGW